MATQYTSILKLALPTTGELSGAWGAVVNDNITSMVEQAIAGLANITTWTTNAHTLTTANGTTAESRCAMLVAANGTGGTALTAAGEIICPALTKLYVLRNSSSYAVTLKTASGTGVAVPSGDTAFLFCDGTNVLACVTTIVDGHISGNLTVDGNTTLGNATSDTITATARFASGLIPSADNTQDLGSTSYSWKDLYIDGTAYLALVDINGGTIDATTIGGATPAAGTFTTATATTGNITTVNATTVDTTNIEVTNVKAKDGTASATIADSTGVMTIASSVLTTTDINGGTIDGTTVGASSASTGAFTTLAASGAATFNGAVTLGDAAADNITFNGTITSHLLFTDNTYDIGASGATRPRNLYLSNNLVVGGAQTLTGALTVDNTTDSSSTTTGSIQTDGGVGIAKALYVGTTLTVDGNTTLGNASTDTVRVNGYMGVGGAGSAQGGIDITNTALSGIGQYGVLSRPTATSGATSTVAPFYAQVKTAAATFSTTNGTGLYAADASKGAGSTIINQHGVYIVDQTQGTNNYGITSLVSSGTNKWNIYASGTATNYFAGNVGIGTSAPATLLHLTNVTDRATFDGSLADFHLVMNGSGNTTGNFEGGIAFADDGSNPTAVISPVDAGTSGATSLAFGTGDITAVTERMRITSTGNVGIGTSAPTEKLEVTGNLILDATDANIKLKSGVTGTTGAVNWTLNTDNTVYGSVSLPYDTRATVGMKLNTINGYPITIDSGNGVIFQEDGTTETMRITSAGNVGIGTSSPGAKLDVAGNAIISVTDNTNAALRITQLGTGNALLVEDSANPDSTPFVVTNNGTALVGTDTSGTVFATGRLQVVGTADAHSTIARFTADTSSPSYVFGKSRGASYTSRGIVSSGDGIGDVTFTGDDGTSFIRAASIRAFVDGTPDTNDMPGRLSFFTTADGASSPTERVRINSAGLTTVGYSAASGAALTTAVAAKLYSSNTTYTDSATAASGTVTHGTINSFDNPAIAATNATVTYTNASTVYIDGAPTAGTNVTITDPYSLYVAAGTVYFGGTVTAADPIVQQTDIGTAANEIPLNQYLGALAYQDTETPALAVGTGITAGTGTICKVNGGLSGGIYRVTILVDLTGLNSGGTAGDIIGVNGTANPCYIALLPDMVVLGGRMTCLETPAGGDTDIDLYSATEGTGVEDQAITDLTETQIINAGSQTAGTVTYFAADPVANTYLYLVGQSTADATYTAGRFLIEIFGVQ